MPAQIVVQVMATSSFVIGVSGSVTIFACLEVNIC